MSETPQQKYARLHPEKRRASCLRHYHKDIEASRKSARDRRRKRYAQIREKVLATNRAWAGRNKDKIHARDMRRKARKKNATLGDPRLISEWMGKIRKKPFVRCHWCGTKVQGAKVHFDHVIPLAKNGSHSIDNLCASCPECNCSKQDRALTDWIKRGQVFLNF